MSGMYSLKKRIRLLVAGFFGGVLLIGIVNVAAAFWGHYQTQMVYELFTIYNDYDDAVKSLEETAVDHFIYGTEESRDRAVQKAEELNALSVKIQRVADKISSHSASGKSLQLASDTLAFQDLCSVAGEFTRQAKDYVNAQGDATGQEVQRMAELTLLMHDMLQTPVENIVNASVLLSKKIWQFQILAIVIIFLAMLCYTVHILYHLSRQVLRPIALLTGQIQRFQEGKEDKKEEWPAFTSCYEELVILYDTYSAMTDTIQRQILELEDKARISEELRRKETALSSAELSLMQSLLTPHFLYNCLSTISSLATIEHASRTYRSSVMIAKFLRESLNNVGQYITIWEEVNYTQRYIEIQKLRFGETICFAISCDPDCAKVQVPAILLQPLIENSISHGVKAMSQGAKITVDVIAAEDEVEMCVCDNGVGIPLEMQKELEEMLQSDYMPGQKGVGLRSVAYRLRDIYGQKARVEIESGGGYTRVGLHIPRGEMGTNFF